MPREMPPAGGIFLRGESCGRLLDRQKKKAAIPGGLELLLHYSCCSRFQLNSSPMVAAPGELDAGAL